MASRRQTDCAYTCVLARETHFLFLVHILSFAHIFLYSTAICIIFWVDKRIYDGGNTRVISLNANSFTGMAGATYPQY